MLKISLEDKHLIAAGAMSMGLLLGHKVAIAVAGTGYLGAAVVLAYVCTVIWLGMKDVEIDDEEVEI